VNDAGHVAEFDRRPADDLLRSGTVRPPVHPLRPPFSRARARSLLYYPEYYRETLLFDINSIK
jgi:hypothetical protein